MNIFSRHQSLSQSKRERSHSVASLSLPSASLNYHGVLDHVDLFKWLANQMGYVLRNSYSTDCRGLMIVNKPGGLHPMTRFVNCHKSLASMLRKSGLTVDLSKRWLT